MSHANAALTPRARLRLARLVVDQGWPIARAAERYDVSWPTAKRWADRYRRLGPAGMDDASSRPHHSPTRTPAPVVRKIVHLRWKQRLGTGPDRRPGRAGALDGARGAGPVPAQPAHPCRPGHRGADPPLRARPPRVADPRGREEARQHPRRRRMAVRRQTARRSEPDRHQGPHRSRRTPHYNAKIGTCFVHTVIDDHSRVAYAEIHDDETAATAAGVLYRAVAWFAARGVARRTRPVRQRSGLPQSILWRDTCAELEHHGQEDPGPTDPRPTARSNASTAPWPTAGRSRSSTTPSQPAAQLCQHGSTTTTTTGPTPQSAGQHPSPG